MLWLKLPPVVLLTWTVWGISSRERFMVSLWMSRCSSRRSSRSAWLSWKLGWRQLASRSSRKQLNSASYILQIQTCILKAIYQGRFGKWVLVTISSQIVLNSWISAIWMRHVNHLTKSNRFDICSSIMTSVLVLTILRRHCHILSFKAGMILTLQQSSNYYVLLINSKMHAEPCLYASSIVKTSHFPTLYQTRYIIWETLMFAKCAEVSK